jgi:hypothetical protein
MNLDSQKFFIGLMDFFSILLLGALLTYLLTDEVGPVVLGIDTRSSPARKPGLPSCSRAKTRPSFKISAR